MEAANSIMSVDMVVLDRGSAIRMKQCTASLRRMAESLQSGVQGLSTGKVVSWNDVCTLSFFADCTAPDVVQVNCRERVQFLAGYGCVRRCNILLACTGLVL
mmetsp:Transcript_154978/g.269515  ORF Transcript_154978/g.269515 Transcript_154978/m.269515 type:complete len:102 (-) Transcript_154978:88-393(-)